MRACLCVRRRPRVWPSLFRLRGGGGLAFDAALFDFDGTLVDSEPLHRLAFSECIGTEIVEEDWEMNCVGRSPEIIMKERAPEGSDIDALLLKRSEIFMQWTRRACSRDRWRRRPAR